MTEDEKLVEAVKAMIDPLVTLEAKARAAIAAVRAYEGQRAAPLEYVWDQTLGWKIKLNEPDL